MSTLDHIFDALWDRHATYLTDAEQQHLYRLLYDAPDLVISCFIDLIHQSIGRIAIDPLEHPYKRRTNPINRRCQVCGGTNERRHAWLCRACDHQRYQRHRARRAG